MTGSNERIEVEGCDTIPKLFWHQVKQRGERTAFREKDLGIWRATSWREYGERAKAAGMGLVTFGLSHGQVVSVRWVLLHMIEETARHNGHLDAVREFVDGVVGD